MEYLREALLRYDSDGRSSLLAIHSHPIYRSITTLAHSHRPSLTPLSVFLLSSSSSSSSSSPSVSSPPPPPPSPPPPPPLPPPPLSPPPLSSPPPLCSPPPPPPPPPCLRDILDEGMQREHALALASQKGDAATGTTPIPPPLYPIPPPLSILLSQYHLI